jgi:transposase
LTAHGPVIAVGVESTGAYGAGLTRHLGDHGLRVIEINQPHPHTRARRGKNDRIDAEAAARKVLSGEAAGAAKDSTGIIEAIRQLSVARDGAIKARSAALCQLGDLIVTAPAELRERLAVRRTREAQAPLCARIRPDTTRPADPSTAAKLALRSLGRRIAALDDEITELNHQLDRLVKIAAPTALARIGVGTHHAATLLVAAGQNIDRFHSEAAFAHLCAVAPIPVSSGKTDRHRLDYGGNRAANRALHMIVIVRLRYCERTRSYLVRRVAEGKTKREAIRCLKRYVAREVFRAIRADLATLEQRLDAL